MPVSFTLRLRCPDCGADVIWVPYWETSPTLTSGMVRAYTGCPACGSRIYRDAHAPEPNGEVMGASHQDAPAASAAC